MRDSFPSDTFFLNVQLSQNEISDRRVLIQIGGNETPWTLFNRLTAQILVRDIEHVTAEKLATDIYYLLHGKFGLVLPAVTVGIVSYDSITAAQINGIQYPYCLGMDDNGRVEFTANYQVIYRR